MNLPPNPTQEQLRAILAASYEGRFSVEPEDEPPAELRYGGSYMMLSEACGSAITANKLIELFRRLEWRSTFRKLSTLAAVAANGGGLVDGAITGWTSKLLSRPSRPVDLSEELLIRYVERHADTRVIVHEKVIYLLEALTLLYSADDGKTPSDGHLVFLALAANDHVDAWFEPDARPLHPHEETLSAFAETARFNQQRDPLLQIIRTRLLLGQTIPRSNRLSDSELRLSLEIAAFGRPFADHFDLLLLPLLLHAGAHWGMLDSSGRVQAAEVNAKKYFGNTSIATDAAMEFLRPLSLSRDEARQAIKTRDDGIPHAPTILLDRPLLRCGDALLVASSPWAVQRQLHTGLWFRMLTAAKKLNLAGDWLPAFGLLVESWCQHVARLAANLPSFDDVVHVPSEAGGADEIEDVVIGSARGVVLASVKSRLVIEAAARGSSTRNAIWDWYESALFEDRDTERGYRHGWIRQLDAKIKKVRDGDFEPTVPRRMVLFPLLVMYDDVAESPMLYDLIDEHCHDLGLLYKHGDVAPLTICTVSVFESLMAAGAKLGSVVEIMGAKSNPKWRRQRLSVYLFEECARRQPTALRLEALTDEFDAVCRDAMARLFPKSGQPGDGDEEQ